MGIKKRILYVVLFIFNFFIRMFPIDEDKIVFVSLASNTLTSDLQLLYEALEKEGCFKLHCVLMKYDKKSLKNNFMYMLNTVKQIWHINRSKMVLLNDNNYVISNFKRKGVIVIQVWHATGAIKKFGNTIQREYPICNYDYVLANSSYWKEPYSCAFGVAKKAVKVTGMPRVDHLLDNDYIQETRQRLLKQYPILQGRKVILYAPTFRGNIYHGFTGVDIDCDAVMKSLGKEYILIYKLHPLLKDNRLETYKYAYNMNHEDTHDLFTITDILVSDFSSVIFDFSLLCKPIVLYAPDLDEYMTDVGLFLDYETQIPGNVCYNEQELIQAIQLPYNKEQVEIFRNMFFTHQDGNNLSRVLTLIHEEMKRRSKDL